MRIVKNKNGIRKKQEFYLFNNIQRECAIYVIKNWFIFN